MPVATAHAKIVQEWHSLLEQFKEHAAKLAGAEPLRAALEESLSRVKDLKAKQRRYTALKQVATKDLKRETALGRERARCVRSAVRAVMGTDNELLVSFGVAPIRKRGGRRKKTATGEGTPEAGGSSET
jgi:predicted PP-loop superfamily ATPase